MGNFIRSQRGFGIFLLRKYYPFLWNHYREDMIQELETVIIEYPDIKDTDKFQSIFRKKINQFAKAHSISKYQLGVGKSRRFIKRDMPTAYFFRDHEDPESVESQIEVMMEIQPWDLTDDYVVYLYEQCKEAFEKHFTETEWEIFSAWLDGWSREEIQLSFSINEDIEEYLLTMVTKLRSVLGIETDMQVPLPYENPSLKLSLPVIVGTYFGVATRYYLPEGLTSEQVQSLFAVSRVTAWRALKNGWIVPGKHIPRKDARWNELIKPETIMDLSTTEGRWNARRHLLARDGWRFHMGAMWCKCGICGKSLLISESTIDHVVPSSKGGDDTIGNLQLAHQICNEIKGDMLPMS